MPESAYFDSTLIIPAKGTGKLNGLTFAVKDVFAVEGHRNSAGNPKWLETHKESSSTSPVIERLLEHGATLKGMAHTDELMFSLNGENIHYGTPLNPVNPECIPGGSSSGSASVVASGLVDFSLGTDTGGSVRVPSSYCGLFGIRPTHGSVCIEGVIPLAPSFDTVGWMSRDFATLEMVGDIILPDYPQVELNQLFIKNALWETLQDEDRATLIESIPLDMELKGLKLEEDLKEWTELFKYIQGVEAWKCHGEWIEKEKPTFSPAIAGRFEFARNLDSSNYYEAKGRQRELRTIISSLIGEQGVIVLPTAASVAPIKNAPAESVEKIRASTLQLTSLAGVAGLPQVTVPIFKRDGMALGLSFIADRHQDRSLLAFVRKYFGKVNSYH